MTSPLFNDAISFNQDKGLFECRGTRLFFTIIQEADGFSLIFSEPFCEVIYDLLKDKTTPLLCLVFGCTYVQLERQDGISFPLPAYTDRTIFLKESPQIWYLTAKNSVAEKLTAPTLPALEGLGVILNHNYAVALIKEVLRDKVTLSCAVFEEYRRDSLYNESMANRIKTAGVIPVVETMFPCPQGKEGVLTKRSGKPVIVNEYCYADPANKGGIAYISETFAHYKQIGVRAVLYTQTPVNIFKKQFASAVLRTKDSVVELHGGTRLLSNCLGELRTKASTYVLDFVTAAELSSNPSQPIQLRLIPDYYRGLRQIQTALLKGYEVLLLDLPLGTGKSFIKYAALMFLGHLVLCDDKALYQGLTSARRIELLALLKAREELAYYIKQCTIARRLLTDDFIRYSDRHGFFVGAHLFFGFADSLLFEDRFTLPVGEWFSTKKRTVCSGGRVMARKQNRKWDIFIKRGSIVPILHREFKEFIIYPGNKEGIITFSNNGQDEIKAEKTERELHISHRQPGKNKQRIRYTVVMGRKPLEEVMCNGVILPPSKGMYSDCMVVEGESVDLNELVIRYAAGRGEEI